MGATWSVEELCFIVLLSSQLTTYWSIPFGPRSGHMGLMTSVPWMPNLMTSSILFHNISILKGVLQNRVQIVEMTSSIAFLSLIDADQVSLYTGFPTLPIRRHYMFPKDKIAFSGGVGSVLFLCFCRKSTTMNSWHATFRSHERKVLPRRQSS